MEEIADKITRELLLSLPNRETAGEFVDVEISFANSGLLPLRNFAQSSGLKVRTNFEILELDGSNQLLSKLLFEAGSYRDTINIRINVIDSIMKQFNLGKYSKTEDKESIAQISSELGISELMHFTRIDNLQGILDLGLNSLDFNKDLLKHNKNNDLKRLDGRSYTNSLSISFPNDKMFYKYQMKHPNQTWCVISFSPCILWKLDCLFCPTNAASLKMSSKNDESLSGSTAFKKLFDFTKSSTTRCYPIDSQAEVLVGGHISNKYIKNIYFKHPIDIVNKHDSRYRCDSFYFHQREYALKKLTSR